MITVNLLKLNSDFPYLKFLCDQIPELPKDATLEQKKEVGKIVYKLGRIYESVERQQTATNKSMQKVATICGVVLGAPDNDRFKAQQFSQTADEMLSAHDAKIWGDPFKLEELSPYFQLTGGVCKMNWLINDGSKEEQAYEVIEPELPTLKFQFAPDTDDIHPLEAEDRTERDNAEAMAAAA